MLFCVTGHARVCPIQHVYERKMPGSRNSQRLFLLSRYDYFEVTAADTGSPSEDNFSSESAELGSA
jgi:hypothetical protein